MNLVSIVPHNDPRWLDLLEQKECSVFHSSQWLRVLEGTYGFDVQAYLLLDEHEQPVAGLPFCQIEDLKPRRLVTLPFCDYCDPIVDDAAHWQMLVSRVLEEGCTFNVRPLHNDIGLTDKRLKLVNRAKWHGLPLDKGEEGLWQQIHSSARRAIRKATQYDVSVRPAGSKDELRAFYELHLDVRKHKYRMLAQPYQFFESIWDQFVATGCGDLLLAYHDGEIVAGVLLLIWKDRLYYKFNASTAKQLACRPNDLLLWEAIKYGTAKNLNYFDFGLSDWDQEGLIRYKRKYATDEKTISFLRYTADGSPSVQEEHLYKLLPQLTDLFTDESVPDHITEKAGELLYRCFS